MTVIAKCDRYYRVWQEVLAKCYRYYKGCQILESETKQPLWEQFLAQKNSKHHLMLTTDLLLPLVNISETLDKICLLRILLINISQ